MQARDKQTDSGTTKYLVAYYISDLKGEIKPEIIIAHLSKTLPEYMIPSAFVELDNFPLTINGKLDRKALPDPEFTSEESYVAPRNEVEQQLCEIWQGVLGLERIGITDDFFRIGGDSILAIRLISKLNNYYKSYLKVSDIFIYKSIELLLPKLIQTKNTYQPIIKLNNIYKKTNMFMIHPGAGGCEVYTSLANALANNFSCYGIDPYNLYHKNKIGNLCKLAKYYLTYIQDIMLKTHQNSYNLLGWSFGGQVALEIASILEQRGCNKINIYLLDTILYDDNLSLDDDMIKKIREEEKASLTAKGYDRLYIEKFLAHIDIEHNLFKQQISFNLNSSKIILFKAMLDGTIIEINTSKNLYNYCLALKYNNIDKIVTKKSNIKVVKLYNAHHGNILNQESLLVSKILDSQKYYNGSLSYGN